MASPLASPLSGGLTPQPPAGDGGFLGAIFGGPDPLPADFTDVRRQVPSLTGTADALKGYGGPLVQQGTDALGMAQRGELTAPQQAELGRFQTGLTNQARQQFYSMGRTPDKDTAFIGQTADIDARVNAMAQQQIQSTIALGLGQLSTGSSLFGQALGFDKAAIDALIQVGQAQIASDAAYRKSLTDTFATIGKMFGAAAGFAVGGPAGAAVGGAAGGKLFGVAGGEAGG